MANINLVPFPDGWLSSKTGMYEWGYPSTYTVLDTVNGKQAIRLDHNPAKSNQPGDRELDSAYITVKPGDHIVFRTTMMTSPSTVGDADHSHGARIALDFYGANGRASEVLTPDGRPGWPNWTVDQSLLAVPWGTSTWETKTIDFIVPATVTADPYGAYTAGQAVVPKGMILTIYDHANPNEQAHMWITDTELYINPTETPPVEQAGVNVGVLVLAACASGGFALWWLTRRRRRR